MKDFERTFFMKNGKLLPVVESIATRALIINPRHMNIKETLWKYS
jgi:hypothetical protein